MDHGFVRLSPPAAPLNPWVPRELRGSLEIGSPEQNEKKFPNYRIRITRPTFVRGKYIEAGDTCSLPGNEARALVTSRKAEFTDVTPDPEPEPDIDAMERSPENAGFLQRLKKK